MIGHYEDSPEINREEVEDFKWMTLSNVKADIATNPSSYTAWFKIIFEKFYKHLIN
jgi:isopentenyl-diphosphate delta-isomerase